MSDTSYYDLLKSADTSQYFSYLNDKYIKLVGPNIRIFKLDKKATILDDVYGAEKNSRIYLPAFNIKAIHLTNSWTSQLGLEPYQEQEQSLKFALNFDNMVATLRDLKNRHSCDILLENISPSAVPSIEKIDTLIKLYVGTSLVKTIDISSVRTTNSLVSTLNSVSNFRATSTGVNEETSKINNFPLIKFQGSKVLLFTEDTTYKNITDVIEMGDVVLTEKWRTYEIKSAAPGGDFGWNYSTYIMDGSLVELDMLDGLPGDYRSQIENHQYGMRKVNKE